MRTLVLGALGLAGLMVAGTGCIITSGDDDDDGPGDGGGDGIPAGCEDVVSGGICFSIAVECPAGASQYRYWAVDTVTGESFTSGPISCGTLGAILVDAGSYDFRVESSAGGVSYGYEALENLSGTDGDVVVVDFDLEPNAGFFWLTWDIVDDLGDPLSCDDVAAAGLSVVTSIPDDPGTPPTDDILKCHYFGWQTGDFPLGDYSVSVALIDDEDDPIAVQDPVETSIDVPSELVDLGDFVFEFL